MTTQLQLINIIFLNTNNLTPLPWIGRWLDPGAGLKFSKEKKICHLPRFEIWTSSLWHLRYTDYNKKKHFLNLWWLCDILLQSLQIKKAVIHKECCHKAIFFIPPSIISLSLSLSLSLYLISWFYRPTTSHEYFMSQKSKRILFLFKTRRPCRWLLFTDGSTSRWFRVK